jgi:hypothetical protein
MGLHGARALTVGDREGIDHGRPIESHELAERCRAAKRPCRRRPEKPQPRGGGDTEAGRHVDTERHCGDEVRSADTPPALGSRDGDRQHDRHGMHDGLLVHAIELRVVDLIGVAHGSRRCR